MSDDEADYMSDNFLVSCAKSDVRPGLIHDRNKKREHDQLKKKEERDEENRKKFKSYKVLTEESLSSGLKKPIGPENKGFLLLQKMGFRPGMSVGSSNTGRTEPIDICIKADRQGLGRRNATPKPRAQSIKVTSEIDVSDFRSSMAQKCKDKHCSIDLIKSQQVCCDLDTERDIKEPREKWFWPINFSQGEEEEEEEEEDDEKDFEPDLETKMSSLTSYLRLEYYYCIWCGVRYEDIDDLAGNCPGPGRDYH